MDQFVSVTVTRCASGWMESGNQVCGTQKPVSSGTAKTGEIVRREGLARSGVISLVGSAFAALAALMLTAMVGNALGVDGTGLFFQAMGIFTILTQVLRLGTNSGIVRFIAEQRAFDQAGAEWRIVLFAAVPVVAVSTLASVAVWFWAKPLAAWLAAPSETVALEALLRAMAPFVLMGAVIGVLQVAARMLRGVTTFTLLQSVLLPASRLLCVLLAISMVGAAAHGVFEAWLLPIPLWLAVTLGVISGPAIRDFRRRKENSLDRRPKFASFWQFSGPRAISSGLEIGLDWSDVLIVAALASPSAAGIYAVVTRAVRAGGVVDKAMRVAVSPTISALLSQGQHGQSTRLHTSVARTMILLNWPFYLLLVSMGPAILAIFGSGFAQGWGPMAVLAAAMMFQTACGMLQSILLQGGRSTWQMYNKSLALSLSIVGNLLLVPIWGIWGAAWTWLIVVITDNTIAAIQVHRGMRVHLQPSRLISAMLIPLATFGLGGSLLRWWGGSSFSNLVLSTAILCLVYAAALWMLRNLLEIDQLWRKVPIIGRYA